MTGAAGLAMLPSVPSFAQQSNPPSSGVTSIFLTPHQDDEMRLTGYITRIAARGDRVVPVCVTDGSSTRVRDRLGLTREQITLMRDREQDASFAWLTNGKADEAIRFGFRDGASQAEEIRYGLEQVITRYTDSAIELYVATWHHDRPDSVSGDLNHDHVQTVLAVRALAEAHPYLVVRYARHYTRTHLGGTSYRPDGPHQMLQVEGAVAAYTVIGQRSTGYAFRMVLDSGGLVRVTK